MGDQYVSVIWLQEKMKYSCATTGRNTSFIRRLCATLCVWLASSHVSERKF